MQLFYSSSITQNQKEFTFSKEESRHLIRVLRKKVGDIIYITNGKGYIYTGKIVVANPKSCSILITSKEKQDPINYKLHIAIAPTKNNDRLEWFIEKATEIGITEITPIICENSERKFIKLERLDKIVVAAMKQSLQAYKPILNQAISFENFIKTAYAEQSYIAHCEPHTKQYLKSESLSRDILILIGPEGDFSSKEIKIAKEANFIALSLGNTRLRTETAGIVACNSIALLQFQNS